MATKKLQIKVCGMKHPENILAVSSLPINYMGFIFYAKSDRYVEAPFDTSIPLKKVGVFVNESLDIILNKIKTFNLDAIQLHGSESPFMCQELKNQGCTVFKVFGVDDTFDWASTSAYLDVVDFFLFDTKSPKHGGTGTTFNWDVLKTFPYDKPYFLSGGLSLENLEEAIKFEDERLIGLDLNSKFEIEPGLKNIKKLEKALKIIQ